jgi:hypothetical protein
LTGALPDTREYELFRVTDLSQYRVGGVTGQGFLVYQGTAVAQSGCIRFHGLWSPVTQSYIPRRESAAGIQPATADKNGISAYVKH